MNYGKMTKTELYAIAQKLNIKNRSAMSKDELALALKKYDKTVSGKKAEPVETVTSHMPEQAPVQEFRPSKPEYPLPDRYNVDTVVLLPVNPKKEYVYWEVSDRTVYSFCQTHNMGEPSFILKVFTGEEDNVSELASVKVGKYGNWYFDLYCPDARLWAEIGMLDSKGNYYAVAVSKRIKMPADRISDLIDKETWMTVGENIEKIYTLSGITDMQKEELLSSARMHSELFKKLHNIEASSVSSNILSKKGGE
ncbi:MAG: DUF4912 domain-containing protein [Deferribacterales bacterium]